MSSLGKASFGGCRIEKRRMHRPEPWEPGRLLERDSGHCLHVGSDVSTLGRSEINALSNLGV